MVAAGVAVAVVLVWQRWWWVVKRSNFLSVLSLQGPLACWDTVGHRTPHSRSKDTFFLVMELVRGGGKL